MFVTAAALGLGGFLPASQLSAGAATSASSATATSGCPTGTSPGVTKSQIDVVATIIAIHGGGLTNATVGVPSVQSQETDWNLLTNHVNRTGGAGCRKIVMHFYSVNSLDPNGAQQVCLTIAASHPFLVMDSGALGGINASNCIPAHKIPLLSAYLTQAEETQYYPYDIAVGDVPSDAIRNGILGLKQLGYFSAAKGFKKLGYLYEDCVPAVVALQTAELNKAGVSNNEIVTDDLGCPQGSSVSSAALEGAVLKFKDAGVTDVTELGFGAYGAFTQIAAQQNFTPHYVFDDSAVPSNESAGVDAPNPANLNGAVDVVESGYGEQHTPGYKPSGGTAQCNAIFAAAKLPNVYKQPDGYGGVVCDYMVFVQALLNKAPRFQASALVKGIHSIGSLELSFPGAPLNYSAAPAGSVYGVGYWRLVKYSSACTCWEVPSATFHAPFK
jgi:hypothetical protein